MEMKERQRWSAEEDALLRAYVKQYGPREWHLVSQRMNTPLQRDSKSCLERWKNYLKPGIKKGSLTEEEQCLVIHLQAKHGNKWKKIAAEVPGRTAKRLGKWWEVYKEKQQRERKENNKVIDPIVERKYDTILENFAEKIVKERVGMASSNGGFLHSDHPLPPQPIPPLPPWLSSSNGSSAAKPASPSVTLSLSSSTVAAPTLAPVTWLQSERTVALPPHGLITELMECCRELEEGQRIWAAHKKEAAWRLKRVELQLETEKASRKREKVEEIEAKVKALRDEERASLERIEAEYWEQLSVLRRDAETKEQKLAEQWTAKHMHLRRFIEQMGCSSGLMEPN